MRQEDIFPIVREYIRRFRPLSVGMPVIDNVLFRFTLQRQVVPRGVNCVQRFIMNLAYRTMPS